MSSYKYRIKDKKIKIYFEQETEAGTIKHYIHPENVSLNAYVRQLSASEQNAANALQDRSDIEFVINKREIKPDMFVEFKGKTYQMSSPDNYMFYETEVKFRAFEISNKHYVGEIYEGW